MASRRARFGRRFPRGAAALLVSLAVSLSGLPNGFSAGTVSAQESATAPPAATIYLGQGHPAYATLELFRGAGLLTDAWLDVRPLSRRAVARALATGVARARERGLEALAAAGEWRLREFVAELDGDPASIEPRPAPLCLEWAEGEASLTAEMTLELAWDGRTDIPPDNEAALIGRGGVEVYGTAGRGIGYAARYRQSNESRQGTVRKWATDPGQAVPLQNAFLDMVAYNESSGHLSFDGRYLGTDIRLDSPAWGPSPERNLLLSGHAPGFGHLQGRVAFGNWLRFTMLAGTLKSGIIDSLRSYQPPVDTDRRWLERQKYLIGHRLELHPLPVLHLGLQEMIIAADRFPELLYLVPTVTLWDAQHYLFDPDNAMMQVDLNFQPQRGPSLYGVFAVDEWQIGDTFADSTAHNWMAFQLGASWVPPVDGGRWHLWFEATRILPYVFRHRFPVNDWTHWESPLGFWSGQNSEVLQGRISWLASPRLTLALWGRYARAGGEAPRSEQYPDPISKQFMFGPDRLGAWVGARAIFEGEHHWRLKAEILRAPAGLWPHDRSTGISPVPPASLGQEWQVFVSWTYNPF